MSNQRTPNASGGFVRNDYVTTASGRTYWCDDDGVATLQMPDEYNIGCECEIDWRCGLHAGQPTWLETRFDDGRDADEARAHGWVA